ncbi:MAG: zinc-binding dehydrogenase [Clostridia bacterium]|nr:zinc-binding dehydrogenase [Clostridia bacterium]
MRAVLLDRVTPAEDIVLREVPVPTVRPGWALVKIKAFGLNHSEKLLRLNEINLNHIHKPIIPGIECVGEVVDPSDTDLAVGTKVVALMGGMGRSFHGSYAEYALLPRHLLFPLEPDLPLSALGAFPETYFTAWGSLFQSLQLTSEDILLVRGATCALGYAAIRLAKALGCHVVATTHKKEKMKLLQNADEVLLDDGTLSGKVSGVTKALDLVGPRVLKDTLRALDPGGVVCQTGLLGGVYTCQNFDPIKDIPNGVYLTGFFSNFPTQEVMKELISFIHQHHITPDVGHVFDFSDIRSAIMAQDDGTVNGKIVVVVEEDAS